MNYGDEYTVDISPGFDSDALSTTDLSKLFQHAHRVTQFNTAPDNSFLQDLTFTSFDDLLSYKVDEDCIIEINNTLLKTPIIIRNRVADLLRFPFVPPLHR